MTRKLLRTPWPALGLSLLFHTTSHAGEASPLSGRWVAGAEGGPALRWEVVHEDAAGLTLSFRLDWVDLEPGLEGLIFRLPGEGWSGGPGDPALPAVSRLLAAPGDADAVLEVLDARTVARTGLRPAVQLEPASDRPGGSARPATPTAAWSLADSWPAAWAELGGSNLWLGHRVQALDLHPLRWNPEGDRVELLAEATLRVTWRPGRLPAPAPRAGLEEAGRLLRGRALNPRSPWLEAPARTAEAGEPGSYLVVLPDAAEGDLGDWVLWKRRQGHEVRLLRESEIGGDETTTTQLHAAIAAEFAAAPFAYLLLVGDVDRYPSGSELQYNLMGDFIPGGQYAESVWGGRCGSSYCIVTDHPFALQEGGDYFADLLVGRWSVDTATDLRKTVRRSVDYEADPFLDMGSTWLSSGLMIYEVTGAASRRETKLAIRDLLMQEMGFAHVDTIRNRYWDNPVSPEVVRQRVNSGVSVVNYRGYGFRDQWYGPMFGVSHVATLTNVGRWPFVTSIVCGGGDFASHDDDPSFGEAWLRAGSNPAEPTGAIGFVGPSEEDTHTEWNNAIDEGIYHGLAREGLRTLGALMDAGKQGLWQAYPNARNWGTPGYNVPFYFHAYNLQGDPGLELRTAEPRPLVCDLPDTLAAGLNSLSCLAAAVDGLPVDPLRGCLYHQDLDLALSARADAAGRLDFPVAGLAEGLPAGAWTLTLWGPDLLPLRRAVTVQPMASLLRLEGWGLGEETADSLHRPGETLALLPRLFERGTTGQVTPRWLSLAAPAGMATVLGGGVEIGATVPGQELLPQEGLEFRLDGRLPYGEPVPLDLLLDGAPIARLSLVPDQSGFAWEGVETAAGSLEPGGEATLRLRLRALGLPEPDSLDLRLGCFHNQVTVLENQARWLAPAPDSSAWVEGLRVAVAAGARRGSLADFQLGLWRADGSFVDTLSLTLPLGQAQAEDPLGPDAAGYLAVHSADLHPLAPVPAWDSIADTGEEQVLYDWTDPWGDNPDGVSRVVELPFVFRYYGRDYTTATVCSNGWLAFGEQDYIYTALNTPIPAAQGPAAMIAAYWTDMVNSNNGSQAFGRLYTEARPAEGLFIVEWNHFRPIGTAVNVDVQLILRDPVMHPTPTGNGEILLQLHDITNSNGDNGVTIGLEAPDERSGLPYAFNNQWDPAAQPISDGCAILFTSEENQNRVAPPARPRGAALLAVHPNPFNPATRLRVELPEAARLRWRLVNLAGQTVRERPWADHAQGRLEESIDGSPLASGLYLLDVDWEGVSGRGGRLTEKLLLLR